MADSAASIEASARIRASRLACPTSSCAAHRAERGVLPGRIGVHRIRENRLFQVLETRGAVSSLRGRPRQLKFGGATRMRRSIVPMAQ